MAKAPGKLRSALDRYQGRDYNLEKQKRQRKEAEKRKRAQAGQRKQATVDNSEIYDGPNGVVSLAAEAAAILKEGLNSEDEDALNQQDEYALATDSDWDDDGDEEYEVSTHFDTSRLEDSDSESDEEEEEASDMQTNGAPIRQPRTTTGAVADDEHDDVPLSDLSDVSDDAQDIISHQRLTINNTSALNRAHASIALHTSSLPFSAHQSLATPGPISITDVNDDLARELAFYSQSLAAVKTAQSLLKAEGIPFTRPADYFAEMVKSDDHMGKIKAKLVDDAASKKAASEARRQRDAKKFGKQVQTEKLKERAKAKREMLDKVNVLKRKRAQGGLDTVGDREEEMFDVVLEDAVDNESKVGKVRNGADYKRQKRDEKYGFGGKKRHAKSGDAASSADMSGYSVKKMKGRATGGKKSFAPQRLGKSRRAKQR